MSLCHPADRCLVDFLTEQGHPLPPLRLLDIGVSGGVYPVWRRWGGQLSGLGVDALENEVERLTKEEPNKRLRYVAALAGSGKPSQPSNRTTYALHRSSAYLATYAMQNGCRDFLAAWKATAHMDNPPAEANYSNVPCPESDPFLAYYWRRFGQNTKPRRTKRTATGDELLAGNPVDLIKIDVDGNDFDALRGCERTLENCIAVEIETQFQGPVGPDANVFSNIDGYLRERGFALMLLEPVRYGRSALPRPFVYDIPANTRGGPVVWSDALYVRDAAGLSRTQRQNLALILDVYVLEDCAAELLLNDPALFDLPQGAVLDFLAQKVHGANYEDVTREWLANCQRSA